MWSQNTYAVMLTEVSTNTQEQGEGLLPVNITPLIVDVSLY